VSNWRKPHKWNDHAYRVRYLARYDFEIGTVLMRLLAAFGHRPQPLANRSYPIVVLQKHADCLSEARTVFSQLHISNDVKTDSNGLKSIARVGHFHRSMRARADRPVRIVGKTNSEAPGLCRTRSPRSASISA
jgi:hypothetical protein